MKKLLFALSCIAAITLMISCSADNLEEQNNTTDKINSESNSTGKVSDSTAVINTLGAQPGIDETNPPRP